MVKKIFSSIEICYYKSCGGSEMEVEEKLSLGGKSMA